jgi:hypothetical protein
MAIHNEGPKNKPNNNRGIAVIPTIGRLYTKIIRNLVGKTLKER